MEKNPIYIENDIFSVRMSSKLTTGLSNCVMESLIKDKQVLVANALKRILRPIVKLMLSNNLSYTFAIDLLKVLFVEVAEKDFSIEGKRQTDSRISLISGVHRKDVRRLRGNLPSVEEVVPENIPLGSQLVAIWNANPKYLNKEGTPKPIPRFSVSDGDDSFESLVRSVSTDIHPRAILDEWLRSGIVRVEGEYVYLLSDVFIPQEGFQDKVYYLGNNLHDHAQAAVANVQGEGAFLERCVHYDGLTKLSIDEINELGKRIGMKALREVNKVADARSIMDLGASEEKLRMTYGIYFYYEPMQPEELGADNKEEK